LGSLLRLFLYLINTPPTRFRSIILRNLCFDFRGCTSKFIKGFALFLYVIISWLLLVRWTFFSYHLVINVPVVLPIWPTRSFIVLVRVLLLRCCSIWWNRLLFWSVSTFFFIFLEIFENFWKGEIRLIFSWYLAGVWQQTTLLKITKFLTFSLASLNLFSIEIIFDYRKELQNLTISIRLFVRLEYTAKIIDIAITYFHVKFRKFSWPKLITRQLFLISMKQGKWGKCVVAIIEESISGYKCI